MANNQDRKICPLLSFKGSQSWINCQEDKCQMWVQKPKSQPMINAYDIVHGSTLKEKEEPTTGYCSFAQLKVEVEGGF